MRLDVKRYPDLSRDGGAVTLRVPGEQQLLVMHPGGNQYAVTSNICTHSGCPLGFEQGEAVCPCHGSRFALDGTVTYPPAKAPLRSFTSRYDADTGVLIIDFAAGEEGFPSVVDGKIFFPFSQFPELKTAGGLVQGVPEGYGKLLFVFALEDGTYSAVDSICTHQGCPVQFREAQARSVLPLPRLALHQDGRGDGRARAPDRESQEVHGDERRLGRHRRHRVSMFPLSTRGGVP